MSDMIERGTEAVARIPNDLEETPIEEIVRVAVLAALALPEAEMKATVDAHNAKGGWLIDEDEMRACLGALRERVLAGEIADNA